MIRRPPRSTPLSLHDALPISSRNPVMRRPSCASLGCSSECLMLSNTAGARSEEHTSELQSRLHLVCRLLLEKKKPYFHEKCETACTQRDVDYETDDRLVRDAT